VSDGHYGRGVLPLFGFVVTDCSLKNQPTEAVRRNQYVKERGERTGPLDLPSQHNYIDAFQTTDDASLLYMPDSTPLILLLLWASDKAIDVYHHGCFWLCGQAHRLPALTTAKIW
jgi:hypothetical protein